jgi:hypothetical protein
MTAPLLAMQIVSMKVMTMVAMSDEVNLTVMIMISCF